MSTQTKVQSNQKYFSTQFPQIWGIPTKLASSCFNAVSISSGFHNFYLSAPILSSDGSFAFEIRILWACLDGSGPSHSLVAHILLGYWHRDHPICLQMKHYKQGMTLVGYWTYCNAIMSNLFFIRNRVKSLATWLLLLSIEVLYLEKTGLASGFNGFTGVRESREILFSSNWG